MYQWLGGYVAQPAPRDHLMILVHDHQPASSVSGEGVTWKVPLHVVSANPNCRSASLRGASKPGLEPLRHALGAMHDLTRMLLTRSRATAACERSVRV
jgi:hypothetical protein